MSIITIAPSAPSLKVDLALSKAEPIAETAILLEADVQIGLPFTAHFAASSDAQARRSQIDQLIAQNGDAPPAEIDAESEPSLEARDLHLAGPETVSQSSEQSDAITQDADLEISAPSVKDGDLKVWRAALAPEGESKSGPTFSQIDHSQLEQNGAPSPAVTAETRSSDRPHKNTLEVSPPHVGARDKTSAAQLSTLDAPPLTLAESPPPQRGTVTEASIKSELSKQPTLQDREAASVDLPTSALGPMVAQSNSRHADGAVGLAETVEVPLQGRSVQSREAVAPALTFGEQAQPQPTVQQSNRAIPQLSGIVPDLEAPEGGQKPDGKELKELKQLPLHTAAQRSQPPNSTPPLEIGAPHGLAQMMQDFAAKDMIGSPFALGRVTEIAEGGDSAPPIAHMGVASHAGLQLAAQVSAPPPALDQAKAVLILREAVETMASKGAQEIELALHPKELGKLRFFMTLSEAGQISISVSAERAETLDMMRRHGDALAQEFLSSGFENATFEFASEQTPQDEFETAEEGAAPVADAIETNSTKWMIPEARIDIRI